MTENQERRGLHTRPLTSALKDTTCLISGSGDVTTCSPGWART
jgi:hypothetical protein